MIPVITVQTFSVGTRSSYGFTNPNLGVGKSLGRDKKIMCVGYAVPPPQPPSLSDRQVNLAADMILLSSPSPIINQRNSLLLNSLIKRTVHLILFLNRICYNQLIIYRHRAITYSGYWYELYLFVREGKLLQTYKWQYRQFQPRWPTKTWNQPSTCNTYVTELTILLTFLRMLVRPLMTRENLYLEMLIKHSLLCSVLTLV